MISLTPRGPGGPPLGLASTEGLGCAWRLRARVCASAPREDASDWWVVELWVPPSPGARNATGACRSCGDFGPRDLLTARRSTPARSANHGLAGRWIRSDGGHGSRARSEDVRRARHKMRQCRRELKCAPASEGGTEHCIASVIGADGDDLAANQSAELCGQVAWKAPNACGVVLRDLTFELRRARRGGARPAGRMICLTWRRAWWLAVGPRLERGVRPRCNCVAQ